MNLRTVLKGQPLEDLDREHVAMDTPYADLTPDPEDLRIEEILEKLLSRIFHAGNCKELNYVFFL